MERTKPLVVDASLAEMDKFRDHIDYVSGIYDAVNSGSVYHGCMSFEGCIVLTYASFQIFGQRTLYFLESLGKALGVGACSEQ